VHSGFMLGNPKGRTSFKDRRTRKDTLKRYEIVDFIPLAPGKVQWRSLANKILTFSDSGELLDQLRDYHLFKTDYAPWS
jgi:hypothetical protein